MIGGTEPSEPGSDPKWARWVYEGGHPKPPAGRLRALLRALTRRTGSSYRRLSGTVGLPRGPWKGP